MTDVLSTLLVNGTDVKDLPGLLTVTKMELFITGERRGSNDVVPGRKGELAAPLVLGGYSFTVSVVLEGDNEWDLLESLAAVSAAVGGGANGIVSLTRRLATGSSTHVDHTAKGQFLTGLSYQFLNVETAETDLVFRNTDGDWWTGSAWAGY